MARPLHAGSSQDRSTRQDSETGQWQWPGPGIFVKVDFGIALTPTKAKRVSLGYVSKNMQRITQSQRHPERMMLEDRGVRSGSQQPLEDEERQRRPPRRQRRSRSALQLRTSPISPESVIISSPEQYPPTDYHPFHPEPVYFPTPISARENRASPSIDTVLSPYRPSPTVMGQYPPLHSNSYPPPQTPIASSSRAPPLTAVRQSTIDRKPLPPLPSGFRLGSDELPWSAPAIADENGPTYFEPLTYSPPEETRRLWRSEASSNDDPQRTRELSQLNQAMIGVGSLDLINEWWEPEGSFDRLGEIGTLPRGPRGVGWAIAVPNREEERPSMGREERRDHYRESEPEYDSGYLSPPPAYTQGQWGWDWEWEESYGYWVRVRGLRRSSSIR
jgi:hypothetical protein